jgi:hypothetical protein
MKNENGTKSNYEMLQCIWMASQVIEYKLCDNQFDCEKCLFDKVMRNLLNEKESRATGISNVVNIISDKLRSIQFDDKIIYLKNNFVAKEICPNTFYLGINPLLICFLDSLSSLILYGCGENIFTGQQLIQIFGPWGEINLRAPKNFLIYDKVGDPNDIPWKSQWFAIIGCDNQEIYDGRLSKGEWSKIHVKAIDVIEDIKSQVPKVGDTMMDGGTQIRSLHQLVGNKKYVAILNTFNT